MKNKSILWEMVGTQELIFNFLPPTLNDQINSARSHWAISATVKKKLNKKISGLSKELQPITNDFVWLEYHWYLKSFARDNDNVAAASKYIQDGLVEAKIIPKDNLIFIQSPVIHYYHKSEKDYCKILIHTNPLPLIINFLLSFQPLVTLSKLKVLIIKYLV
jgi:hypothetical protein